MAEETHWFHLDKEHGSYNGIEANLEVKFAETRPDNTLSVNTKIDNKESLVKLVTPLGWYDSTDADFIKTSPALFRTFTTVDHREAFDLVRDPLWTGP